MSWQLNPANIQRRPVLTLHSGETGHVFDVGRIAHDGDALDVVTIKRTGGVLAWWRRRSDGRIPGDLVREDAAVIARHVFGPNAVVAA